MLGYKVFGAGIPGLAVQAICQDAGTSISAAGTAQGDATQLTNAENEVTTVAALSGVILYGNASAGDTQSVFNAGANPLRVYPPSGQRINALPLNAGILLATNTGVILKKVSATRWFGVLSA